MILFRISDLISVLFWRMFAPCFGSFGRRVRIVKPLRIVGARFCELEDDVTLQTGVYVAVLQHHAEPPLLRIGRRTRIGNHAHIVATHRVEFGEAVLVADRVFVADNGHAYENPDIAVLDQGLRQLAPVRIGDGSWIGENVTIVGCSIGRNCVVGANSVVNRDVPDHCVVAGSPAQIVRRYCRETGRWRRTNALGEFSE